MSSPRNVFPRSPSGLFIGSVGMSEDLSRSASGSSSNQFSPLARPGLLRRRSTDTSGGLDYYWSSLAGAGPNSSSSSLAISPSPSIAFGSSPGTSGLPPRSKSQLSLSSLKQVDATLQSQARLPVSNDTAGPSNRRIHVVSYPSTDSVPISRDHVRLSSGADSESSSYSPSDALMSRSLDSSDASPVDYRGFFGSHEGEAKTPLMDPSEDTEYAKQEFGHGHGHRFDEARESVASGSTFKPETTDEGDTSQHKTPMPPPWQERPDLQAPPRFTQYAPTSPNHQTTPTRSSASSHYTPSSGRLAFVAPADVSRSSLDALEREVDAADSSRMAVTLMRKRKQRRSKGEIGAHYRLQRPSQVRRSLRLC
ncbi:hypothetical protein BCR39DRAFT_278715 [Naematelia encephala]|uniref:Uncharacterized protein n=1 Tax=Naematelia encephala TaxID=71784 RepID=A0A1Y2ATG3_9TREE|nr:hypothetical protein BCR39DRAFT_278715 [Naematelia encephala]